jgi:hypothetical protein
LFASQYLELVPLNLTWSPALTWMDTPALEDVIEVHSPSLIEYWMVFVAFEPLDF